MVIFKDSH